MKARYNVIRVPAMLLVLVLCLFTSEAMARAAEPMRISGRVTVLSKRFQHINKVDTIRESSFYGLFKNKRSARKSVAAMKAALMADSFDKDFNDLCRENGFSLETDLNGEFYCTTASPGMVIAAVSSFDNEISEITEENIVKKGKKDYTIVINSPFYEKADVCLHCLRRGMSGFIDKSVTDRCKLFVDSIPEDECGISKYYLFNRPFKFLDFTAGVPDMTLDSRFYGPVNDDLESASKAVQSYFAHKKDYIDGKRRFSGNDFYNLYTTISDSLELDTVTMIAYNYLVKPKRDNLRELYAERIAPYVLNRVARMLIAAGAPDTTLLMPFIDEPLTDTIFDKEIDVLRMKEGVPNVFINMTDILVTQALGYLFSEDMRRAYKYMEWMNAMSRKETGSLAAYRRYMGFIRIYAGMECDRGRHYLRDINFVMNSSILNNAVLSTEISYRWDGFDETCNLLDLLDDNDPRKWYMKGMLWAQKVDSEEPDLCAYRYPELKAFKALSEEEENALLMQNYPAFEKYASDKEKYTEKHNELHRDDFKNIRHYLAYFHHSFKLGGPMFRKCYFIEGQVSKELRKKYKYKKSDFEAYEELFKLLKARDDENRDSLLLSSGLTMDGVPGENAMRVIGCVNIVNGFGEKRDTTGCSAYYGIYEDVETADSVKMQLDSLRSEVMTAKEFQYTCRMLGLSRNTNSNGRFVTFAEPGKVILAVTTDGETAKEITDDNIVREGKTDYTVTIGVKRVGPAGTVKGRKRYM